MIDFRKWLRTWAWVIVPILYPVIGFSQPGPPTPIAPDCNIPFVLSSATSTSSFDNRSAGCTNWVITYTSSGFTVLALALQSAPDSSGTPGTWVSFAGSVVTGINPNTAITQNSSTFNGYFPWLRVNLSGLTGTGTVRGAAYGWRTAAARIGGTPPGGAAGGCLAGTYPNPTIAGVTIANGVVFSSGSPVCLAQDANFTWTPGVLSIQNSAAPIFRIINTGANASASFEFHTSTGRAWIYGSGLPSAGNTNTSVAEYTADVFQRVSASIVKGVTGAWRYGSGGITGWSSSATDATAAADIALARNAAGVMEINNGTAGTFASAKLRYLISGGAVPGISGCTGATVAGTSSAGSITSGTTGACSPTLTFGFTAPTGWACSIANTTTVANLVQQSGALSTTTVTFTGTTVANDVLVYMCRAF